MIIFSLISQWTWDRWTHLDIGMLLNFFLRFVDITCFFNQRLVVGKVSVFVKHLTRFQTLSYTFCGHELTEFSEHSYEEVRPCSSFYRWRNLGKGNLLELMLLRCKNFWTQAAADSSNVNYSPPSCLACRVPEGSPLSLSLSWKVACMPLPCALRYRWQHEAEQRSFCCFDNRREFWCVEMLVM